MISLPSLSMPMVTRELHSYARSKSAYWLRVLVVGVLWIPAILFEINEGFRGAGGKEMFAILTVILSGVLLLLGSLITAGCLSSEKESGTLGLLFLSPLNSFDIVAGKWISNFLRLFSIALAGLPVLATSFMFGGVTWEELFCVWILQISIILLVVSTAVLASAFCFRSHVATVVAYVFSWGIQLGLPALGAYLRSEWDLKLPEELLVISPFVSCFWVMGTSSSGGILVKASQVLGIALAQSVVCVAIATWWLPRTLVSGPTSPRLQLWSKRLRYHLPTWRSRLNRLRSRKPLLWLEWRRSLLTTGIVFVLIVWGAVYLMYKNEYGSPMEFVMMAAIAHTLIATLLLGHICREICRERSQRTLEALLCAPLDEREIVWAKFKGMWLYYGSLYLAASLPVVFRLILNPHSFPKFPNLSRDLVPLMIAPLLVGVMVYILVRRRALARMLVIVSMGLAYSIAFSSIVNFQPGWSNEYAPALVECLEDIPLLCMLFAVSFRSALFSRNATTAVMKAFGWMAGFLLAWGMVTFGVINWMVRSSSGGVDFCFSCMVALKIFIEIMVFSLLMQFLPQQLRQQSSLSVDSA
jgi:ABC-type transport system involved in multi-copper enzyme maturation permease subunit